MQRYIWSGSFRVTNLPRPSYSKLMDQWLPVLNAENDLLKISFYVPKRYLVQKARSVNK